MKLIIIQIINYFNIYLSEYSLFNEITIFIKNLIILSNFVFPVKFMPIYINLLC